MSQARPPNPKVNNTTTVTATTNAKQQQLNRFNISLPIAPPPPPKLPNNNATCNLTKSAGPRTTDKKSIPTTTAGTTNTNKSKNGNKRKRKSKSNKTTPSSSSSSHPPQTSNNVDSTSSLIPPPEEEQTTTTKLKTPANSNGFGQFITAKMGKFSASESQLTQQAVRDYCTQNNVTIDRLCSSEIDARSEEFRGVWRQISQILPHRTTRAVYRHAMRVMHPFKRGEWTEEETRELMLLVVMHGKKWVMIQNKLNRMADACRDKYREFHLDFKRGVWTEEETKLFEKHVRDVIKVKEDVSMYEVELMIQENSEKYHIPWDQISRLMGNRSRLACFRKYLSLVRGGKHDEESSDEMEDVSSGKRYKIKPSNLEKTTKKTTSGTTANSRSRNDDGESSASSSDSDDSDDDDSGSENGSSRKKRGRQQMSSSSNTANSTNPSMTARSPPISTMTIKNGNGGMDAGDASSYDRQLLRNLATSSYSRSSDVNWNAMRYPLGNAEERWQTLVDEWIEMYGIDEDEVMDKPIWEVAKEILNQGVETTEIEQAELAARTVEAVFLF